MQITCVRVCVRREGGRGSEGEAGSRSGIGKRRDLKAIGFFLTQGYFSLSIHRARFFVLFTAS